MEKTDIYDVVIIGGGTAGSIAALAASICGARVLVIEKNNFLGGTMTSQPLEALMSYHYKKEKIVSGIPNLIINELKSLNASPGHIYDSVGYCETITPYNNIVLRLLLNKLFAKFGVDILFSSEVKNISINNNYIEDIIIEVARKNNIEVRGKVYIDCSGDGITFDMCNIEYTLGNNKSMQPASILFKLSNVNCFDLRKYSLRNIDKFKTYLNKKKFTSILENSDFIHLWGFEGLMEEAYERNELSYKKKELQMYVDTKDNSVVINGTRLEKVNGINEIDRIKAYETLQKQALELYELLKNKLSFFTDSYISILGSNAGIRETRHMVGEYKLTLDDIVNEKHFDDTVAYCAFPVDIHEPEGDSIRTVMLDKKISIPYRSLLPRNISNLLVAGRCISVSHEVSGSLRTTVSCMAQGQIAGIAAALSSKKHKNIRAIKAYDILCKLEEIRGVIGCK